MKSFIKNLFYDKALVDSIKKTGIDKNYLYTHLIDGKITLAEYLQSVSE